METFFQPRTSTLILNENETLMKSLGWHKMRREREARLVGEAGIRRSAGWPTTEPRGRRGR